MSNATKPDNMKMMVPLAEVGLATPQMAAVVNAARLQGDPVVEAFDNVMDGDAFAAEDWVPETLRLFFEKGTK